MAFLFTETGIISRFLLHHVRGHYPSPALYLSGLVLAARLSIPEKTHYLPCYYGRPGSRRERAYVSQAP